jgi:hypothetical protein
MTQQTIKSHEFTNKSRVELLFDEGNYATIGKVQSYLVLFLEYNKGPYYEGQENDHHYMVCNTVHFPLSDFLSAVRYFQLYIDYIQQTDKTKADSIWNEMKRIPNMRLEEIKSFHDTLFEKKDTQMLPGISINFQSICSTGRHENSFGVGSTDISLHRTDKETPWMDLIEIKYSNPTQDQLLDAQTTPGFLSRHTSDINRRVSFKQACLIQKVVMQALDKEFKGTIPADDDL